MRTPPTARTPIRSSRPPFFRGLLLLLAFAAAAGCCRAATWSVERIPHVQRADRDRYVSDPDGILSRGAVAHIDSVCGALRARGLAQMAVVAVGDIEGGDAFDFAIELFRSWGVGRKGADDGVGILLVRDLREIRFVTGGGVEGVLTDALCKRIQVRCMLPEFRRGDYDAGMVAGVDAVAAVLTGAGEELRAESDDEPSAGEVLLLLGALFLGALLVLWLYARRLRRCPRCGKSALVPESRQLAGLTPGYRLIDHIYRCEHCGHRVRRRERRPRDNGFGGGPFVGGFGGGSFGGGSVGGGFGGGSFGGGGAGSKW